MENNGLQLTDESAMKLKNEFVLDDRYVIFLYIPFQDDDTERDLSWWICYRIRTETTIVDIRRIQKKVRTKICSHTVQGRSRCPL